MFKKFLKFLGLGIVLIAIMAVFVYRGMFMGIQRGIQNKFYDYDQASSEIVIVAIDEKSLQSGALGKWEQWSRENYARAVQVLRDAGVAAIGIDVTFPDASSKGEEDDRILQEALKNSPNAVLAARYYFENGKRLVEWPNAILKEAGAKIGWINVQLDEDGFIRQFPLFAETEEGIMEAFSLQLARIYKNADPVDYRITKNQFAFSEKTRIPVILKHDEKAGEKVPLMYINYFGEPNSFTQISFVDLLNKRFVSKKGSPVDLRDKIVLIGPTAIDLQDHYLSPVSEGVRMAGVEVHANAIQTIISGEFLKDQSEKSLWISLAVLLAANLILFAVLKVRYALPVAFLEVAGILIAGIVAYEFRVFLNVIYPIILVTLSFIGAFLLRFILEEKERRFIENAFGHYVNASVVAQILKNPKMLELGGAKRRVTVFFSDIAGFTTTAEKMEPQNLVKFLNEYLEAMTEIILSQEGTLDKYEGDGIVAFWGAPVVAYDHAKKACLTALLNQERLKNLRKKWAAEGKDQLYIRIGIHTGDAVVGNMGSAKRFDYTAVGDTMNLGSRLEGINKQYGTPIIISENTYTEVKDGMVCRKLDKIRVKGKAEPVTIYELVGQKNEVKEDQMKLIQRFEESLGLYQKGQFKEAMEKWKALKDDPPSRIFAERCETFLKNPPPKDWDGVYTFTTK